MRLKRWSGVLAMVCASGLCATSPAEAQYTVERPGAATRLNFWIGEGIAGVYSSNSSAGHRFRIGAELQLGEDYQYVLGITFLDRIGSGETSSSVGDISRNALGLNFGYFFVPSRWWLMYALLFQDVSGNAVIGSVTPLGHQFSLGYRFYSTERFNLALEAAYAFVPSYDATTFNYSTNVTSTAGFPLANIYSLNFRVGFDLGGL